MSQHQVPEVPAQSPGLSAAEEAYGRGYLEGHLAGWRDALAAQAADAGEVSSAAPAAAPAAQAPAPAPAAQAPEQQPSATPLAGPQWTPTPAAPVQPQPAPVMPQAAPVMQSASLQQVPQRVPQYAASPRSVPPLSPAAMAAKKSKRETQNINITLYVASLLMVAAAALFVGSSQPVPVRLVGVWLATTLFYGAGLLLHGMVERLRPAAVAFTGTGLAIVPFAGLATYNLGFPDAPAVWLLTSLIGTAAYAVAAIRLQSRLVVYFSLAFLLSTAWSSVAVLGAALAWYFAALIVFSALLALAGQLLRKGGSRFALYAQPISDLGPWFAPVGLVGSLAFSLGLNAADHTLVLVAGVIYYGIMTGICAPALRRWNYLGLRLSLTLAAPFIGWLIVPKAVWAIAALTLALGVQTLVLAYRKEALSRFLGHPAWVSGDVVTSLMVLAGASGIWTAVLAGPWRRAAEQSDFAGAGILIGLVITMAVVPAFLPKGEWFPLPAAGVTVACAPFLQASDWIALLFVALVYATYRQYATRGTLMGHAMMLAARLLLMGLVAAILAQFIAAQPGKIQLILAVVVFMTALQLVAEALLAKTAAENLLSKYAALTWGIIGSVIIVLLAISYAPRRTLQFADSASLPLLRTEFWVATLALGLAIAAYSLTKLPRTEGHSRAEFMAPSYIIVAGISAGPVLGAGGASIAWALGLGYLLAAGNQLRVREATVHRWLYWWGARLVSLALATALFQWWRENDANTLVAGTHTTLGAVLLLALVPQLAILVLVGLRGRSVKGLSTDAGLTLLAAVILTASVRLSGTLMTVTDFTGGDGLWTSRAAVLLAVVGVAAVSIAGTLRSAMMPSVLWAGPGALAMMTVLTLADRPLAIMVVGIASVAFAILAAKAATETLRGLHFLLARIAVTVFALHLTLQLTDDPAVLSLVLTGVMLAQLGLQTMAATAAPLNVIVGERQFLRTALWLLLITQIGLPIGYVLASGGFQAPGTGLRWVVAVELVALVVSALVAQLVLKERGASYAVIAAVIGGAVLVAPLLVPGLTTLMLLLLSVAAITWRCLKEPKTVEMRWQWLVATGSFLLTAHVVDSSAATGFFAAMWLVAGAALVLGAHLMKTSWLTLPGSLMVLLSAFLFRSQVLELVDRPGYAALAGFVVVVGALYIFRMVLLDLASSSQINRGALLAVALGGGAIFALWTVTDQTIAQLGAAAFTLVAVLACVELPTERRRLGMDVAVLSSALVWFWASSSYVDLGVFWFVQWMALAFAVLAVIRYRAKALDNGKRMLMVGAAAASLGGLLTIFSGNTLQQVVSLLVFVALLAIGMGLDERVFTIWGAVGVATAVVWYLRGFTYILLALLALGLIAFAVWRLNRKKPHGKSEVNNHAPGGVPGSSGMAPHPGYPPVQTPMQQDYQQPVTEQNYQQPGTPPTQHAQLPAPPPGSSAL